MRHLVIGGRGRDRLEEQRLRYVEVAAQHGHIPDIVEPLRQSLGRGASHGILVAPLPRLGDAQVRGRLLQLRVGRERSREDLLRAGIVAPHQLGDAHIVQHRGGVRLDRERMLIGFIGGLPIALRILEGPQGVPCPP